MKLVIDFSANQITIEGDGPELIGVLQAAREVAPMISEIKLITASAGPKRQADDATGGVINGNGGDRRSFKTMREFVRSLSLSSITERMTAIAYYAKHNEGKAMFSGKDMDGWFTLCGLEKPAQMSVALSDAKRKGGTLESPAYGTWRMTTSGENLITRKIEESQDKQAAQ